MSAIKICAYPCSIVSQDRHSRAHLRDHLLSGHQCIDAWIALSQIVENAGQRADCLRRAAELAPEDRALQVAYLQAALVVDPHNEQLKRLLAEQQTLQMLSGMKTTHFHPEQRPKALGDILVAHGAISETQLAEVLKQQRNGSPTDRHRRLGEILVARTMVTPVQLARALIVQQQQRSQLRMAPQVLGEFLVERGYISAHDLEIALAEQIRLDQQNKHYNLGKILVHLNLIRQDVIDKAAREQELSFWDRFGY
jgi:hypothetical protein